MRLQNKKPIGCMTIHMASYGKQNYRLDRQIKSKKVPLLCSRQWLRILQSSSCQVSIGLFTVVFVKF